MFGRWRGLALLARSLRSRASSRSLRSFINGIFMIITRLPRFARSPRFWLSHPQKNQLDECLVGFCVATTHRFIGIRSQSSALAAPKLFGMHNFYFFILYGILCTPLNPSGFRFVTPTVPDVTMRLLHRPHVVLYAFGGHAATFVALSPPLVRQRLALPFLSRLLCTPGGSLRRKTVRCAPFAPPSAACYVWVPTC